MAIETTLKPQHIQFLIKYLETNSPTNAYLSLYPNASKATASANAAKILKKQEAQEYLVELRNQVDMTGILTLQQVMQDLSTIAVETRTPVTTRLRAYHQLSGLLGGYKNNLSITSNNHTTLDISYLSDSELDKIIEGGN